MLNPAIPDLATSLIEDVIFSIHNENDISENQFKTIQYIELSRTELIEISAKLGCLKRHSNKSWLLVLKATTAILDFNLCEKNNE
ncbi:hypothetical protein J4731_04920 [Providencia rettgeri]|nr:hypothetical protein [Providencia rettgeri]